MKTIGGFFEMELPKGESSYHLMAGALSTGRACFKIALQNIKPSKVYIPFYTCDALITPLIELQIPYEYYALSADFVPELISLQDGEYALYTNYFGLCSHHIQTLLKTYYSRIIIDNTQAFFEKDYPHTWSFNSARKFFGVPDGAYLYAPIDVFIDVQPNDHFQYYHLIHRFTGKQKQAYAEYVAYERSLDTEIRGISMLSERLLSLVDYRSVANKRKINFEYYAHRFGPINKLKINWDSFSVPFAYPLLLETPILRHILFDQQIFVPTFWQDVLNRDVRGYKFEKMLASHLLPLPVDHRYDVEDCKHVADAVEALIR